MKNKITYGLLLAVFCLSAVCGYAQNKITAIQNAETARFKAMMNKDTVALKRLIAGQLVYIHSNGLTESKSDFIHSVGSGKIVYAKMTPESNQVIRWGRTAAVNGVVQVEGMVLANPFNIKLRYLSVYHREHGIWKLVRWQSTKV